jgi:hypothetical protein
VCHVNEWLNEADLCNYGPYVNFEVKVTTMLMLLSISLEL